jgi:uncharacterized protein (TIGR00299 family) protein
VRYHDLAALLEPVTRSELAPALKARAAAVLTRLVEAEARVHGLAPDATHLHEVGALDTLVDVVGAVAALDALGIGAVHVSALPLGGGSVDAAHGRLPVPAPATAELLRGFVVYDNGVREELVTPTGAAILTTLGTPRPLPAMTLETIGRGAGTRQLALPNLLRVLVGHAAEPPAPGPETVTVIETAIDDMSPQLYEPLMERLLEAGALDVYLTPVIMKKSRPGVVLTALAPVTRAADLWPLIFRETTTIGLRWRDVQRAVLPRELARVETALGPVTFKLARLGERVVTATPEFEEVRRLARERGLAVREALERVREAGLRLLQEPS